MSWGIEVKGTKAQVKAQIAKYAAEQALASHNPADEAEEIAFVCARALRHVAGLDLETPGGELVRVAANGSHGWNTSWDIAKDASPKVSRAAFTLVVERVAS